MVLSNSKCMHIRIQNSEISIQGLQSYSSNVSSNRIKIQVILLILQLETDCFSSYSFQKCSIRSSGTTVFTETSRTAILHEEVLQDSSAPILQGYPYTIHIQPTCAHYTTVHPENSPSRIHFYMSSSSTTTTSRGQRDLHSRFQKRNSTHRRQGDLLEIHPCVLQDIPDIPVFPDIPVVPDTPKTFRTFQSFMTFQPFQAFLQVPVPPGIPPHYSILQLECIFYIFYKFYSSIGFHRKLHRVPVEQYKHSTNIIFFKEREMLRYGLCQKCRKYCGYAKGP